MPVECQDHGGEKVKDVRGWKGERMDWDPGGQKGGREPQGAGWSPTYLQSQRYRG